jgi:hypothetical protein
MGIGLAQFSSALDQTRQNQTRRQRTDMLWMRLHHVIPPIERHLFAAELTQWQDDWFEYKFTSNPDQ